jgi:hypothetical protein
VRRPVRIGAALLAAAVIAAAVVAVVLSRGDDDPDLRAGGGWGNGPHGRWARIFSAQELRLHPARYGDTVGFSTSLASDEKDLTVRGLSLRTPCLVLRNAPPPRTGNLLDATFITLRGVYRAESGTARRDCIGDEGDWLRYDTLDADVEVGGDRRTLHVALQGPVYLAPPGR